MTLEMSCGRKGYSFTEYQYGLDLSLSQVIFSHVFVETSGKVISRFIGEWT